MTACLSKHPLDRLFWIYSGKSIYSWIRPKQIEWRFVGDDGYEVRIGEYSKQWKKYEFPLTPLLTCQICGKTSTPKKLRKHRPFTYEQRKRYGLEFFESINTLCWSCCNRLRPFEKTIEETDKLRLEANRIRRKINESTKNNARTA